MQTSAVFSRRHFSALSLVLVCIGIGCLFALWMTFQECRRMNLSVSLLGAARVQRITPLLWWVDLTPLLLSLTVWAFLQQKQKSDALSTLTQALEQTTEGVSVLDVEGRYRFINEAYARTCGYTPLEMAGMEWMPTVFPEDHARMLGDYERMKQEGKSVSEVRGVRKNGERFHKEVVMIRRRDARGNFIGHYCCMREITARKLAECALQESEARFQAAIAAMQDGFVFQNEVGEIVLNNASAERILGLTGAQMRGLTSLDPHWQAIHEDGTAWAGDTHPAVLALREGIAQQQVVMGLRKPTDELTWMSINAAPLFRPGEDRPSSVVVTFADVTELKQYAQQLERLASTDGLTGLKNHRTFQSELDQEFVRCARYQLPLSLILLDVDHFKRFNDKFGHPAGDEVLKTVSALLLENARASDLAARYGGEEFVVLLPNTDSAGAAAMAERFRGAIEAYPWEQQKVTASFGAATLTLSMAGPSELTAGADAALYHSKSKGRNCVTLAPYSSGRPV